MTTSPQGEQNEAYTDMHTHNVCGDVCTHLQAMDSLVVLVNSILKCPRQCAKLLCLVHFCSCPDHHCLKHVAKIMKRKS